MMSLESKRKWIFPKKIIETDILESILKERGVEDQDAFFSADPSLIPDSSLLYDSSYATKRIIEAVENNEKIVIHGDYDADGICASAILWDFLYRDLSLHMGKKIDVVPYIPSRIEQGYGLTESSINDVIDLGAKLLISVDCGVRDCEIIHRYMEKGLDFVITDHHQPPSDMPSRLKYPLVHQMYPKKEYPFVQICGATVAFLLIQQIKKEVGIDEQITEDTKGLDLVALATVTDMMPLQNINRVIVKLGLNQMRKGQRVGLKSLLLRAGIDPKLVNSYHLGYVIGPRINASGRIGSPMEAVKLLVSRDEKLCNEISNNLEILNAQRQKMTEDMLNEADLQAKDFASEKLLFVIGHNWHEGVIGLVAGKLLEKYHKPVLVATNNDGVVKGSARSIQGFNITKAFEKFSKYLERYGGHELAGGFTLKEENVDNFRNSLLSCANENITDEQLVSELNIDLFLNSGDIGVVLINDLVKLEPFGYGNPRPLIVLTNLIVFKKQVMGKESAHMKLTVKGDGIGLLTLTLFNCYSDTEKIFEENSIDVVGYPDLNVWNGNESVQFNVKEWKFSC